MESGNARSTLTASVLIVVLSTALFLFVIDSSGPIEPSPIPTISSLLICGNSTDILYPELMEAEFQATDRDWSVTAKFLDDSEGFENLSIYWRDFTVREEELHSIVPPLLQGLGSANLSTANIVTVLGSSPSIAWQIELVFTNGSWVYLTVLLTEPYALLLLGHGPINRNLLDARVLEPASIFAPLALAISDIFANHLG